ncbi:MAG: DegT/DnrJ/EryC1/StrS family aminotransferase [Flavobacteriaceae bacterium]|nr:DegT/DnrJ/EryC1/StrS family aminotransferase [Flavobacteriaceae bacterium]
MNKRIWLSPPDITGLELKYINDAFASNWIAPVGPNINTFETDIETYIGKPSNVVALNSGTAAIHLALDLLGIGKGDEILCQSKTFIASVNPVIYKGAIPIFIDSEELTWNMCPDLLEKAIQNRIEVTEKKPKAIIVVDLYGMPYQVDKIHNIANHYGIPIIEDSAEAFGSRYNDKYCGTFGEFSIFSFNGNKIITTSGGGALITRSKQQKERAIFLATQANDTTRDYNHSTIGYNYRMSNILAGIGRGQIRSITTKIEKRRANFDFYYQHLHGIPQIQFQPENDNNYSNRWLTCITLNSKKNRDRIIQLLNDDNIETKLSWKPMHMQPVFKDHISFTNGISEDIYKKSLCLPSGSSLTQEDLIRIVSIIKTYFTDNDAN